MDSTRRASPFMKEHREMAASVTKKSATDRITTIAFDFGGVLVRRISDEYLCHMAYAAGADPARFVPALWRHRNGFDSGELDARSYWRSVLDEAGVDAAHRNGDEAHTISLLTRLDALGWSAIRPGMVRWVSALEAAGYRRLIISNMAVETYELAIRTLPIHSCFERVVLSGVLGINKPDRRIFETAVAETGVLPEQILFIDDLPHNVEGARTAGLKAVQFTEPESFARDLEEHYPELPRTGLVCG